MTAATGVAFLLGCGVDEGRPGELGREELALKAISVDARRSLAVTDQAILQRFSFKRVMDQLVTQSGVTGLTSLQLFNQWWDTQNPAPGLGLGAHCDDTLDSAGTAVINGYPYTCRPAPSEGALASRDPFAAGSDGGVNGDEYLPIALTNRFDLAPADGSNCGEYRIVYAKRSGLEDVDDRNLLIFEAVLPNKNPSQGLKGCKAVAKFWADLSLVVDVSARADALEDFYFDGLSPFPPVIHVDHFGNNPEGAGQVRTNQFVKAVPRVWSLREFKLLKQTVAGVVGLRFAPATVKVNPFGPLFAQTGALHSRADEFRGALTAQVAELAVNNINGFNHRLGDTFNTAQSQASASVENNYAVQFGTTGGTLSDSVQTELTRVGSALTPLQVVLRAQALSCAGCHRTNNNVDLGGGLVWPPSLGFTHVTERETEEGPDGLRFKLSVAMTDVFLPHRKLVLEDFVNKDKVKTTKDPKDAIGGRQTH